MPTIQEVKAELTRRVREVEGYTALAKHLGLNKGIIWYIVNTDYEPKRQDIRRKLGLPERIVMERYRGERGRFK